MSKWVLPASNKLPADNANEGNANSDILISQNIIVSGTFQAGSLYIETPMVTIPGTLDISGGGYLNDKGPGKKLTFRLIATSVFKKNQVNFKFYV
jgi:hypothetical protein